MGDLDFGAGRAIQQQLSELEERLKRVEARLGLMPLRVAPLAPAVKSDTVDVWVEEVDAPSSAKALAAKVQTLRRALNTPEPQGAVPPVAPALRSAPPAHPPTHPHVTTPVAPGVQPANRQPVGVAPSVPLHATGRNVSDRSLESLIGGKLFLGLGALIVVIGVGFALKLGVERGWFSMPPIFRCLMAAGFGAALIALGELARRKISVLASTGLSAAGIAIGFSSVYAAWAWYGLMEPPIAFVLLVCVCILGIGVALVGSSLAIGVLSLVGAYVTPLIFHASSSSPLVLPAYLLALLVLGLVLAGWKPHPFRALRGVVWWGTVVMGTGWLVFSGHQHTYLALGFLGVFWLLIHAELYLGSRREPEAKLVPMASAKLPVRITRPIVSSFATTLWSVAAGVLTVQATANGIPVWGVPTAGFIGTLCLAMVLAGHLRILQDKPETDAERLGAGMWMQAAGLSIVAVALALSGWTQVVAWLGMGLAAIGAGRWLRARSLDGYGLTVLVIAVARLIVFDSWRTPSGGVDVFGLMLTRWSVLMALAGAAWLAAAWLIQQQACSVKRRRVIDVCIGLGLSVMAAGTLTQKSEVAAVLGVLAILGAAIALASGWRVSRLLQVWSSVILLLALAISAICQLGDLDAPKVVGRVGMVVLTDASVALLVGACAWWIACWAFRAFKLESDRILRAGVLGCGLASWLLIWCAPTTSLQWTTVLWALSGTVCAVLPFAFRGLQRFFIDTLGLAAVVLAACMWVFAFTINTLWNSEPAPVGVHPGLWVAFAIVGVLLIAPALLRRRSLLSWSMAPAAVGAVSGLLLLGATSLEVARGAHLIAGPAGTSQRAAVSIWWGMFSVGLIVLGFWRQWPLTRHAGLALLGIATLKAVIFDLSDVAPEWRVASFIGLGLLMLGVAIGYARISKRLSEATNAA